MQLIDGMCEQLRDQDLAAWLGGWQASRPDRRDAGVVDLVAQPGLTGVDGHAHRQWPRRGPRLGPQGHLRIDRSKDCVRHSRERCDDTVSLALRLRSHTAVRGDRIVHGRVVALHGKLHRGPGSVSERGARFLDIRQEEGDGADRDRDRAETCAATAALVDGV